MKFRLQCAGCGATFFAPDRRARHCPKCVKKGAGAAKKVAVETKPGAAKSFASRPGLKPGGAPFREREPRAKHAPRAPKAAELTPELLDQVTKIYQEQFAGATAPARDIISQISDKLWLQRKAIGHVINKLIHPSVPITSELKERIIETYKGYVERSERPAEGRRRAIAAAVDVPFHQVKNIVYEWSVSQYAQSPTPELTREQLFEIEKIYWDELGKKRYRYDELPEKIVERLGYVTTYQVSRWLDTLHDDESKFKGVADAPQEAEQQIIEAYRRYLDAPQPPEQGLHGTIASQVDGVSARQVHKVLQQFRYRQRDEYPLK